MKLVVVLHVYSAIVATIGSMLATASHVTAYQPISNKKTGNWSFEVGKRFLMAVSQNGSVNI